MADLYQDPNAPTKPLAQRNTQGLHDRVNQSLTNEPTNTGPMAPAPSTPAPPAVQPSGTPISANDWAGLGVTPAQATPGMPVPNQPGKVLQHNGYGWEIQDAGQPAASSAPSAPPAPPPPGTSDADIYRKALLDQMNQQEVPNVTDPAIAAQLDPIRNEQQRMLDREIRQGAEAGFAGGQSYGAPERIAASERAGERTALAASDLVGRELSARRAQISDALAKFGARMSDQERQALELKLKEMDNAIQREGLKNTRELGLADIDLRRFLGTGGLNNDLIRIILANKQANNQLGADIGFNQARLNQSALQSLMEG